jgi:hypothetical protein
MRRPARTGPRNMAWCRSPSLFEDQMTHRRLLASAVTLVLAAGFATGLLNCDKGNTSTCVPGYEKCPCAAGNACLTGLTCLSNTCVRGDASTSSASTSSGMTSTGSGGMTGTGGMTGSGGTGGMTAVDGGTTSSSTGTGGSTGGPCGPGAIDDFSSSACDMTHTTCLGGTWQALMGGGATQTFTVSVPPGNWTDHTTCAAWTQGGPDTAMNAYVGFGTQLAGGAAYNLMQWTGATLLIEGQNPMFFQLKAADGGVFQVKITGMPGGSTMWPIKFTDMQPVANTPGSKTLDLTKITEVQLMADVTQGFGYALHSIALTNN